MPQPLRQAERLDGTGGAHGPWAFRASASCRLGDWSLGGVIGIHGMNQPRLLPGRPSHGCVRVRIADLRRLVERMPIGRPSGSADPAQLP